MADAVSSNVVYEDRKQYVIYMTSVSDGTGESLVRKVVLATIGVATSGLAPVALDLERVQYVVTGFANVKMFWDHAADSTMVILAGSGTLDFTGLGGLHGTGILRDVVRTSGLQDPKTADSTGDVLLTSAATAGGTYGILCWFNKRAV